MSEYPGLMPWHFGGDDCLTYDEMKALVDDFTARINERKKQARGGRRR